MLITWRAAQLRCGRPAPAGATWARWRQLGIRRARRVAGQVAEVQQMRDLLECAWPAVLDAARQPLKSITWHAALTVALARAGGDLASVTRLGRVRFSAAVRRQVARWDAVNPGQKIIDGVFAACAGPAGVTELRHGALERAGLLVAGWRAPRPVWPAPSSGWSPSWGIWAWPAWSPRSPACPRPAPPASWPRPGTPDGSPPAARWSSTPAWRRGKRAPAAAPGGPA